MHRDLLFVLVFLVGCGKEESPSACDGEMRQLWLDEDGDSYGSKTVTQACELGPGLADNSRDCDDADASVHPGATEVCNDVDDDCDGTIAPPPDWYADADGDGYGAIGSATPACDAPKGSVADGSDCDDTDVAVNPSAIESCANDYDDDCDGVAAVATDDDGDGYLSDACAGGLDCDDAEASIHPGAVETCGDGVDSDCDLADGACSFAGEYDIADADAEATTNLTDAWAGNEVDAGDVTGDGIDDVLIGAVHVDSNIGGGFVLSGAPTGNVSLDDAAFYFRSGTEVWGASRSIGVGDVDGDGIADVAFGAPYPDPQGQFIVYGPITGDVDLAADHDVALTRGGSYTYCGHGSDLGDVNGDGLEDSVIGAYMDDTFGTAAGKVYVTFGPLADDIDLETSADVAVVGEKEWGFPGRAVKAGRDVNGDGIGDVVLNATYDNTGADQAGGAYVLYGPVTVSSLDDAPMLTGSVTNAFAGNGITFGDYDGDGFADVAVSVDIPGAVAIVRGPVADGETSLAKADVILEGATTHSQFFGYGLGTGDLERDGVDELLVGDLGATTGASGAGIVYLVADPPTGTSVIDDVARATFLGEDADDGSGTSVTIADLDGSGSGDIVIGAYRMSVGGGIDIFYGD